LLFLLSVCSLWMFVSLITEANSFRHVAALTVVNLLLVYSHYYGWLLIAVQALALFIVKRSQLKAFLIGCALLVIGYVLWVFEIARGHAASGQVAQNIGWIPRPRIQQVAELWVLMNQPFLFERSNAENEGNALTISLMLIVFAVPLAVLCWRLRKRDQDLGITRRLLSILLILAFGPPILVGLLSWILPYSVWGTRHLIIAMPVYGAIVALGLTSLRPYWAKVGLSLIFGCWLLVAGFYSVIKPAPVLIWCCWEQLAERMIQIESRSPQTVSVYAFEDLVGYHLWFALKRSAGTNFKVNVIKNFPGANEDPAYFLPRNFDEISAQQSAVPVSDEIWIAFRASAWDQNRQPLSSFVQAGYQNGRVLMLEAQGETAFLVQLLRK